MYQQTYHHRREKRFGSYFLPFLSLIILGLIAVLVFQIVVYFQQKRSEALQNKAALTVLTGRAEMKVLGVDQWTAAVSGTILHDGDFLRTGPGSRAILTLLNGSVIRFNSETEVQLTSLKTRDSQDEVALSLKKGEIWLKRASLDTVHSRLFVKTKHLEASSLGTIFDVSDKNGEEAVRILDGKIKVAVLVDDPEKGSPRTAETFELELGQEVRLGGSELSLLQNRKPVLLLSYFSDDFRGSEWFSWNRQEDLGAGSGLPVAEAVKSGGATTTIASGEAEEPAPKSLGELSAPQITAPSASERTIRNGKVVIRGTVEEATDKVEVTTYISGKKDAYVLQKYTPGALDWSYVASKDYGNLVPGENRFTIVAIDKEGTRSEPAEITIMYDAPKEPADLSKPSVLRFNGSQSNETAEDSVKVEGKIGKGITKVFVNDFALTKYVPDSGVWVYYAKTAYRNLQDGTNIYKVYGVDVDDNKTPVLEFTIVKKPKPVESEPPPAGTTTEERPPL